MNWFLQCVKEDYANFSGRARRKEYWFFVLFQAICLFVALLIDLIVFGKFCIFYGLCALALFIPNLAVTVRRLHDTNRSGQLVLWLYLIVFGVGILGVIIPMLLTPMLWAVHITFAVKMLSVWVVLACLAIIVYVVYLLIWLVSPGTQGDNQYGPDPKAVEE